ncbi:hypothetical protein L486_04142 [Kwoniella mangroviensis CBS 10435]|uniref:Uncharacterized protein n=1 Tax=Kwoniella mangroviensis CBS 10435 TaxID=1331196 RepID=A0A1B9IRD4_9TREE|nr:hypothetical protein L486_04142 [Kwoniella mangroviensis CBS 10435]
MVRSRSRQNRKARYQKRQDVAAEEQATKTISVQTQTVEIDAAAGGNLPTPSSILDNPTGGMGQLKLAMMWETINEFYTEIGKMTEKCLIPADDPSQKFCETLLNGEILGGANGDGTSTPNSSSSSASVAGSTSSAETVDQSASATATATATEGGIASSSETSSSETVLTSTDIPPTTLSEVPSSTTSSALVEATDSASISDIALSSGSAESGILTVNFTVQPATPSSSDAAVEAASEAADTVSIPGQQLQVLPIGLGVLGGLAGIAILVVLYVTYQRRKFKKQFRSRKLAEDAAPMAVGKNYGSA